MTYLCILLNLDWGVGVIGRGEQKIESSLDIDIEKMNWDFFCEHSSKFSKISVDTFKILSEAL